MMILLSSLATTVLAADLTTASAFTAFQPTCKAPPENVTWVTPPYIRGTLDIIWGCFSVLLICTWTIQYLSVPPHKEPKEHSWKRQFVKNAHYSAFVDNFRFNITKLKWMTMSLLAPELILAKTLAELLPARDSRRHFKTFGCPNEWTITRGFFANMRGFVLRFNVAAVPTPLNPAQPDDVGRSRYKPRPDFDPPYYT